MSVYGSVREAHYRNKNKLMQPICHCRANIFANLSPVKDMEVMVTGCSLTCKNFQRMMYTGLRALIDQLHVSTLNAAILGIKLDVPNESCQQAFPGVSAR